MKGICFMVSWSPQCFHLEARKHVDHLRTTLPLSLPREGGSLTSVQQDLFSDGSTQPSNGTSHSNIQLHSAQDSDAFAIQNSWNSDSTQNTLNLDTSQTKTVEISILENNAEEAANDSQNQENQEEVSNESQNQENQEEVANESQNQENQEDADPGKAITAPGSKNVPQNIFDYYAYATAMDYVAMMKQYKPHDLHNEEPYFTDSSLPNIPGLFSTFPGVFVAFNLYLLVAIPVTVFFFKIVIPDTGKWGTVSEESDGSLYLPPRWVMRVVINTYYIALPGAWMLFQCFIMFLLHAEMDFEPVLGRDDLTLSRFPVYLVHVGPFVTMLLDFTLNDQRIGDPGRSAKPLMTLVGVYCITTWIAYQTDYYEFCDCNENITPGCVAMNEEAKGIAKDWPVLAEIYRDRQCFFTYTSLSWNKNEPENNRATDREHTPIKNGNWITAFAMIFNVAPFFSVACWILRTNPTFERIFGEKHVKAAVSFELQEDLDWSWNDAFGRSSFLTPRSYLVVRWSLSALWSFFFIYIFEREITKFTWWLRLGHWIVAVMTFYLFAAAVLCTISQRDGRELELGYADSTWEGMTDWLDWEDGDEYDEAGDWQGEGAEGGDWQGKDGDGDWEGGDWNYTENTTNTYVTEVNYIVADGWNQGQDWNENQDWQEGQDWQGDQENQDWEEGDENQGGWGWGW